MRDFERQKFLACVNSDNDYNARLRLCSTLQSDFQWWLYKLKSPISRSLVKRRFFCEIFSDASLIGWGASMGKEKTHGWWSFHECKEHINFLELKAVEYALKSFVSNIGSQDILLRVDNTTYI